MEQMIKGAILQQDWDLLRSFLLGRWQLLELEYAVGQEEFIQLISNFQMIELRPSSFIELHTSHLYYFVREGMLVNNKTEKKPKSKLKRVMQRKRALLQSQIKTQINFGEPVPKDTLTKVQDLLQTECRQIGYYRNMEIQTIVLKLNAVKINNDSMNKIRHYFSEKIKSIGKLQVFWDVPRHLIQQSLDKFQFLKTGFNELLYSANVRKQTIFILVKGQAMIQSKKAAKGMIVKPPNILGFEKSDQEEQARCLTQYIATYNIVFKDFQNIFRRKAEEEERDFEGITMYCTGKLRAKYIKSLSSKENTINNNQPEGEKLNSSKNIQLTQKITNPLKTFCLPDKKSRTIKLQALEDSKKQRIKEHFSNFMSEQYGQYSSKITGDFSQKNKQRLVFYMMKSRVGKAPDYQELKDALKQQRMKNILLTKQNFNKSNSSETVLRYRQQDINDAETHRNKVILDKITRNLELKISKLLEKKRCFRPKII